MSVFDPPGGPIIRWAWKHAIREVFGSGMTDGGPLPPPTGYDSWDAYAAAKELSQVTDFLPLGVPPEGARANLVWTRTGEDVATCGLAFVHANPDVLGDTLEFTGAEMAALETRLETVWTAIRAHFPSSIVLDRIVWHHFGVGIRKPNPQAREIGALAAGGTGASDDALPPQVATSVTLKTDHRRTWGRIYLPAMVKGECVSGRIVDATAVDILGAFGDLLEGAAADSTPLVIWSPRRAGKALEFGKQQHIDLLDEPDTSSFAKGVTQVQVDDLFDVERSRRFAKPLFRETHTLGA